MFIFKTFAIINHNYLHNILNFLLKYEMLLYNNLIGFHNLLKLSPYHHHFLFFIIIALLLIKEQY